MFEYLLVVYDNEAFGRFTKLYRWNERIGVYDIYRGKDLKQELKETEEGIKRENVRNKQNKILETKSDNGNVSESAYSIGA